MIEALAVRWLPQPRWPFETGIRAQRVSIACSLYDWATVIEPTCLRRRPDKAIMEVTGGASRIEGGPF
jgi:hypothetical protein